MKTSKFLLFAVYASFFALGMPDGAFGVAWPSIRYEMGLPLERAAMLIAMHSILYSVVSAQMGWLIKALKLEWVSGIGMLMLVIGMLFFSLAPNFAALMMVTAILGAGMGMVDTGANAFASARLSARHMNWLHCFWGMGGSISPIIMRQVIIYYDWRMGYMAVFVIQAAIAVVVFYTILRGMWTEGEKKEALEETATEGKFLAEKRFQVIQWLIFFLYTSFEYSVTFWTVSVLMEGRGMSFENAGLFPAVYLGSLMAGRFIFGIVTEKIPGSVIIRLGLLLSVIGLALLVFTDNIFGIALTGFGFAPVFPCLMTETKKRFDPHQLSKLVGLQIAAAGAGAAIGAFAIGRLLETVSMNAFFPAIVSLVAIAFLMNEYIEFSLKAISH
ncbi:MAG: MFS transporter [Defluviitaleaceae bacterium]|nr:MFS transporter [Defluviitaleaceae bacterium]